MNTRAIFIGGLMCAAVSRCFAGAPAGPWQDTPTLPLDGNWHVSVRHHSGFARNQEEDLGEVAVPGAYFLPSDTQNQETTLTLQRPFSVPAAWREACAQGSHVLAEFDSVDYRSTVEVAGSDGAYRKLGEHEGYIGRFAFPLGLALEGQLRVTAWDLREGAGQRPEYVARTTLQGIDPTAWGRNPCGILESARLRLVGPVYLRNAYAVTLTPGNPATVRLGAELVPLMKLSGTVSLRCEVLIPGQETPLLQAQSELHVKANEPGRPVHVFKEITVPGLPPVSTASPTACRVRLAVEREGRVSDTREVSLFNRRFSISGTSIQQNGESFFMKGAGSYQATRLLGVKPETFRGMPYVPYGPSARTQSKLVAEGVLAAGAEWIRFAHHVPYREVHEAMRAAGIKIYQDFPLLWRTDYRKLPQQEILRQFDEFLWRVSAEPAVGIVAVHNEPEFESKPGSADRSMTQRLINALIARTGEIAPHLIVIGASGGYGTAAFPPDREFPINDPVLDRHAYLAPHWEFSFCGYRNIPKRVAALFPDADRPVIWSELAGGFMHQHAYILGLDRSLDEAQLPPQVKAKLVYRGQPLTVRQAFAALAVLDEDDSHKGKRVEEAKRLARPENDPLLIRAGKEHFFADRAALCRPDGGDLNLWSKRVCASWLAAQIYESRLQFLEGRALCGTVPWDSSADIGFPLAVEGYGKNTPQSVKDVRGILAASYAPLAVYARSAGPGGEVSIFVLNDGTAFEGTLELESGGRVVVSRTIRVGAHSVAKENIPRGARPLQGLSGSAATLNLVSERRPLSRYFIVLP